tara:strand:- start:550 stop:1269 length:720 start_codon:yes stop_codon:yes gene_type:complete
MVSVDTVYQRVLALVNKEQRGYITPQEFNLFAGHAQNAIFEQYFYDLSQFDRGSGTSDDFSDMSDVLQEKISLFKHKQTLSSNGSIGGYDLPVQTLVLPGLYRIGTISANAGIYKTEVERVEENDLLNIMQSYLARPSNKRPVYTQNALGINVYPSTALNVTCDYVVRPKDPNWTYTVIGNKALYNSSAADLQDFQLHESEETSLVLKILTLSGLELQSPELYQTANQEDMKNIQQEKA